MVIDVMITAVAPQGIRVGSAFSHIQPRSRPEPGYPTIRNHHPAALILSLHPLAHYNQWQGKAIIYPPRLTNIEVGFPKVAPPAAGRVIGEDDKI